MRVFALSAWKSSEKDYLLLEITSKTSYNSNPLLSERNLDVDTIVTQTIFSQLPIHTF